MFDADAIKTTGVEYAVFTIDGDTPLHAPVTEVEDIDLAKWQGGSDDDPVEIRSRVVGDWIRPEPVMQGQTPPGEYIDEAQQIPSSDPVL